jgi:predicted amidohydrolase YtcJ
MGDYTPAFADTHIHQLLAARDLDYVSLEQARSIDELVRALRDALRTRASPCMG